MQKSSITATKSPNDSSQVEFLLKSRLLDRSANTLQKMRGISPFMKLKIESYVYHRQIFLQNSERWGFDLHRPNKVFDVVHNNVNSI